MVSSYIAWYLFLAGAGSGAYLIGSLVDFALRFSDRAWFRRASSVTDAGLVAGPVLVVLGAVFLTLDLGAPEQAFRLFLSPSGSLLSLGAWAIALFCIVAVAAFAFGAAEESAGMRVAETAASVAAALLALFIMVYAGVFLSLYPAIPFLHTPLVPALFVASALATGAAALIVVGFFRSFHTGVVDGMDSLLRLDLVLVAVEAAVIVLFAATSLLGDAAVARAFAGMMTGECGVVFWIGVVGAGLVVPLSVDAVCLRFPEPSVLAVGAGSTLVGGACLRFALLMASQRYCLVDMSVLSFWT